MARVEIATLGWGVLTDANNNLLGNTTATLKNLDGSNATTWSAQTGGSSSSSSLTSDTFGVLPRFVDEGTYTLTVTLSGGGSTTRRVEAKSGLNSVVAVNARDPVGPFLGATGNDSTDDYAALERARADAVSRGLPLYVPAGNYKHSAVLNFAANGARMFGDGPYLTVFKPTHAGVGISIGDDTNVVVHTRLSMFSIVGTASTTRGIQINDLASRWTISHVRITSVTGTPGEAIGMTEATGTPSKFSGLIERCELNANTTGIKAQGRHQHLTIRECMIYNNTSWGIDAEGDSGSIAGGRINIVDTQVEKNGTVANTTGSIRLAGTDVVSIRGWYNEQDGTYAGCSLLMEADETGVGCSQVAIDGAYMLGNTAATKSIILKKVTGFTRRNTRVLNFTTGLNNDGISFEPAATADLGDVRELSNNLNAAPAALWVGPYDPAQTTATNVITANTAYLGSFTVERVTPVATAQISVATQAGNCAVAIYDDAGNRIATTGSVAVAAAGRQAIALTATVWLRPGVKYWAELIGDTATAAFHYVANSNSLVGFLGRTTSLAAATFPPPATQTVPTTAFSRGYLVCFT